MRTEQEIYGQMIQFAEDDPLIRAVGVEGSRTNPTVKKDLFQDFDISYFVTDMEPFMEKDDWLDVFGERLIMQKPEAMALFPPDLGGWFSYLILFKDGNRIDLTIIPLTDVEKYVEMEKGMVSILLDKDRVFPDLPPPTDEAYHVKKPSREFYHDCCNEFWWVLNNVAKGLWREEIPYVMDMINFWTRSQLVTMLSWYVGIRTDFSCSVGKNGKYLDKYLPADMWNEFLKTYPEAEIQAIWTSVFDMCELFEKTALLVGDNLGFDYNSTEAANSFLFLKAVRNLPKDATEIFSEQKH